jgi:predicted Holliday junction resolvase-like endonuclease
MEFIELVFIVVLFLIVLFIGYLIGKYITQKQLKERIPEIRDNAIKQSRAVLSGQFSEQLAPFLPDFPYKPTEARFIGKPIDFVVFNGMDEKKIDEVVFVEVKSGQSQLSKVEKTLKSAIENKNVSWHEYKVPEEVTKQN